MGDRMRTSINKKLILIMGILLLIGVGVGVIFVLMLDEATREILFLNINEMIQNLGSNHINNILSDFVALSCLLVLAVFVIGIPLDIFYLFYNGFSIGFVVSSLTIIFGIKGLLYGTFYILITRGLYIFLLLIYNTTILKISRLMIDKFINKESIESISMLIKKALLIILLIIFIDIFVYFLGVKILDLGSFLIK